eukprot:CAMPEP_0175944044 /NCGR_PEP_ID=MMETSP0108-20121206/25889_1 /TAXON_ID=195067 ORGANISM="Goniomonas pacifica, Strain CCMP1869" /NCGR_SAMPLE_ID=MMETSP0108 /ASSEMBLY_ACC=CAM_ASM_000204 /LENGTH=102 /DNA_ID=CAMNT_0017269075 /DNA_START=1 /DNA_END=309 /DNA_ORIENTATION=+
MARYPEHLFRILSNRRLLVGEVTDESGERRLERTAGLLHWLETSDVWRWRQVPLLVFHGAYTEGLDEARRRRGCVSTNDAAVALLFAKMAANSALRRQFQQT